MAKNTSEHKEKVPVSVDMNSAFYLRKEDRSPKWRVIDAKGQILGRLATHITNVLRGKDKPLFTPHTDCGDYVVVINAEKIVLTGDKWDAKEYITNSGWMGGKKVTTAKEKLKKDPTSIIELAVKRMLPKNRLSRDILDKLKVYVGEQHPHQAQVSR